jgi:hypothetical protein
MNLVARGWFPRHPHHELWIRRGLKSSERGHRRHGSGAQRCRWRPLFSTRAVLICFLVAIDSSLISFHAWRRFHESMSRVYSTDQGSECVLYFVPRARARSADPICTEKAGRRPESFFRSSSVPTLLLYPPFPSPSPRPSLPRDRSRTQPLRMPSAAARALAATVRAPASAPPPIASQTPSASRPTFARFNKASAASVPSAHDFYLRPRRSLSQ